MTPPVRAAEAGCDVLLSAQVEIGEGCEPVGLDVGAGLVFPGFSGFP
jgi:hypothetical protein